MQFSAVPTRRFGVQLHRWVGLTMTIFLVIVGLTGSLLAFLPELNRLSAPQLFPAPRACSILNQAMLAEMTATHVPQARINGIYVGEPGTALAYLSPRINPETGQPYVLEFDSLFLDPCTGSELGRRMYGDLAEGWINFMPFVYRLHYNLALGSFGMWVLGITALLWTIDCFVSAYLTLPAMGRKRAPEQAGVRRGYWSRWKPSWLIKWQASAYRINFDLHRAGGLWTWLALLIFAWSSVFMNLHDQVYAPITRLVLDYPLRPREEAKLEKSLEEPALGWRQAHHIAERLMDEQARIHGFIVERPINFWIDRPRGTYRYVVRSSLDFQDKRGRTAVIFDANTGELKQLLLPSGQHSGVTVTNWLQTLHEANVFGLPYRIFICILGLVITMLSVTGVYIWWKKHRARAKQAARLAAQTS
jgi:uncharacterized iron-regulated membrane protein